MFISYTPLFQLSSPCPLFPSWCIPRHPWFLSYGAVTRVRSLVPQTNFHVYTLPSPLPYSVGGHPLTNRGRPSVWGGATLHHHAAGAAYPVWRVGCSSRLSPCSSPQHSLSSLLGRWRCSGGMSAVLVADYPSAWRLHAT